MTEDSDGQSIAEIHCCGTKKAPLRKCWDKDVAERVSEDFSHYRTPVEGIGQVSEIG